MYFYYIDLRIHRFKSATWVYKYETPLVVGECTLVGVTQRGVDRDEVVIIW